MLLNESYTAVSQKGPLSAFPTVYKSSQIVKVQLVCGSNVNDLRFDRQLKKTGTFSFRIIKTPFLPERISSRVRIIARKW